MKGPNRRGFSYVELWMVGVQTSLLVAIFEYGIILALKKYPKITKVNKNQIQAPCFGFNSLALKIITPDFFGYNPLS